MQPLRGAITLACKKCGREMAYARKNDPGIPNVVKTIVSDACDRCDRGDFGSERYFDAAGRELDCETWKPFGEIRG